MKNPCAIVQDLLPLHADELLSPETEEWMNEHLYTCPLCKEMADAMKEEIIVQPVQHASKNLMKNINWRMNSVQLFVIGFAFIAAMSTSLNAGSYQFMLTYPILGTVAYLYYKDMRIVSLLSFVPIFIWNMGYFFISSGEQIGLKSEAGGSVTGILDVLTSSVTMAIIHYVFALLGSLIGFLILKSRGEKRG